MNLFIFGANWYNRGDESALRAMVDELMVLYPNCDIRIHFNQEINVIPYTKFQIVKKIRRPSIKTETIETLKYFATLFSNNKIALKVSRPEFDLGEIVENIKWADLMIYSPGGPSIGDIYKQYHLVDMMFLAKKNNTPYVIYAPSMGPFKKHRRYIRKVVDSAQLICFREDISRDYYQAISPNKKTYVTLDSAFQHRINVEDNEAILLKDHKLKMFLESHDRIIGVTITDLNWHGDYRNSSLQSTINDSFKELVDHLYKNNYAVIFIPQLFGVADDETYMSKFTNDNSFILPTNYDCYFQQFLISKLTAMIGMRYHSNIFSAKMGIPFISISYEQKMRGFMKSTELEKYCIDVKELSSEKLIELFDKMMNNYGIYKANIAKKRDKFQIQSYETTVLINKEIINLHLT